jgi:hypothetical protein
MQIVRRSPGESPPEKRWQRSYRSCSRSSLPWLLIEAGSSVRAGPGRVQEKLLNGWQSGAGPCQMRAQIIDGQGVCARQATSRTGLENRYWA